MTVLDMNGDMLLYVFAGLGVFSFTVGAVQLVWNIWRGFLSYIMPWFWKTDLKSFGEWAVVTGATSGIGKAYAHELARRGLNVILISRCMERLKNVAAEIEKQHGQKTRIIQADFTGGYSIYEGIEEKLKGLEIGILVNNVGMIYAGYFCRLLDIINPAEKLIQVINCNILSVTQMSIMLLPEMIKRKKGLIINISSEMASHPHAMSNIYSSTKGFINYFSRSLHAEYKDKGIIVQCVMPLVVSTNMAYNLNPNLLVKDPDSYAKEALGTVGYSTFTSGCLSHALQHYALNFFLPGWFRLSNLSIRQLERFASKYQKKNKEE
ncbi:very-long-chain 3-oxoacyl-CoA reductase-like [Polypterus senegalus]|uniref:very-long-chain 3-oxoacyl-CoA reductase-like n=1 Tax=Polypterus senegalus TaxID=55291 RepID=UPI00196556CB|nr:very-long-chain 3-oxoacyl-CoA reductase-like [Polypterus senegalus]